MSIAQTPDGIVDEGTLVILRCMAFGKPDPKIYWKKNKLILQIERNLVISAATASDTGVYTCVAESDQNTTQKKVEVLLKIKCESHKPIEQLPCIYNLKPFFLRFLLHILAHDSGFQKMNLLLTHAWAQFHKDGVGKESFRTYKVDFLFLGPVQVNF